MGRQLLTMSGSSLGFLRMGVTAASLSVWGTEPELMEEFIVFVMSEELAGKQSLNGMESRTQVELLIPTPDSDSSAGDTGQNGDSGKWGGQVGRWRVQEWWSDGVNFSLKKK